MLLVLLRLQKYRSQDGGYVMVVVIAMLLILTSLLSAYMLMSKAETASTEASNNSNTGFYAAETGLNQRAKLTKEKFVGYNRPSGTSPGTPPDWKNCIDNISTNNGSGDFACSVQAFNSKTIVNGKTKDEQQKLVSYVKDVTILDPATGLPESTTILDGEPFARLSAQEYRYDVVSAALDAKDLPTAIQGMLFKSRLVPMFQFAAFYDKDLEISPGANMNLSGRVHTNGDLYLNTGATLTINGQVSTTKASIYRGQKRASAACEGTVNIFDPGTARALACSGSPTTYNNSNVTAWNGRIVAEVPTISVPPPESFDPTPGKLYWDKSDLRIVLQLDTSGNPTGVFLNNQDDTNNSSNTSKLWNSCTVPNTTLKTNATSTSTVLSVNLTTGFAVGDAVTIGTGSGTDFDSNVIKAIDATAKTITLEKALGTTQSTGAVVRRAVVSTSNTFYNYRENRGSADGTFIRMLEVDLQSLIDCAHQQSLMDGGKALNDESEGGLVWYMTVKGPKSATINEYGVRVRKGSQIASTIAGAPAIKGLTIISDQAVYVLGNYNSTAKKPAAFLADTVNILSEAWTIQDSRSRTASGSSTNVDDRVASNTTINAAFLSGTDSTGGAEGAAGAGGAYNGGLENYPRFHESWSGKTLTYRGSFVSLNTPRYVNGAWCGTGGNASSGCNIYNAPTRNWDYDTDFNNAANLPPLTPRFVYLRQENFTRSFDR